MLEKAEELGLQILFRAKYLDDTQAEECRVNTLRYLEGEEDPTVFFKTHVCPDCHAEWEHVWGSLCKADCPHCGKEDVDIKVYCEYSKSSLPTKK